jgi:predicted enzyme related to lactoylglutathione lyase
MTSTTTTTPGAPVWIDYVATDPAAATEFYGKLFGWKAEPLGSFWQLLNNGRSIAGLAENGALTKRPDGWLVYLLSLDVDSTSLAAHSNGGDVFGRFDEMITVQDSQSALVGGWNPGEHEVHLYSDETGAPVWHELHAKDYDSAIEFYENVFEWDPEVMSDTVEFRYSTLGSGQAAIAGIFDAKDDLGALPSHWKVYFAVDDADAAAKLITELGGTLLTQPEDTPFGRMAHALDHAGAPFSIIENRN